MRKLTEEQANEKDMAVGAIPIGKYVNVSTKREYQCTNCGNIYRTTPDSVIQNKQITCQQCSIKRTGIKLQNEIKRVKQIFQDVGFETLFDDNEYINCKTKLRTRCMCGKEFYVSFNSIRRENTKSCGHCKDPKINDKIGKLTIIDIKSSRSNSCSIKCKCDCGNITNWYKANIIITNQVKSCSHCNDPILGEKYGKLTPIIIFVAKQGGCKVICECECGRDTKILVGSTIVNGDTKSCGNCELLRNGIPTSYTALELHRLVEKILNKKCEHNKYIQGRYFDIVCVELKIAIEYDGYYFHRIKRNTTKRERKDEKILKIEGYKFLRIRSDGCDMPTEKQLRKVLLNDFQHGSKKRTITMNSWKIKENKN